MKIFAQEQQILLEIIKDHKKITDINDSPELKFKRETWLGKLLANNWDKILYVFEMYPADNSDGMVKTKKIIPQYFKEYTHYANTRTQITSETRAEVDKLPLEQAIELICEICDSLIQKQIHFAVFYAEGQRSPHLIIYDLDELKSLNRYQRVKARAKFWRWIIPFRVHLLDQALWDDEHFVPIEFAIHWRHGTPFNLIFEYNPREKKNAIFTS